MLQVSDNEVKNRLRFDNPWWQTGAGIGSEYRDLPRRAYLASFYELINETRVRRAVVLMGPRRVGKTVMVFHAIHNLLSQGVPGNAIMYLSLDTPVYTGFSLEKLTHFFQQEFKHTRSTTLFIFFDEIQYLKNWEVHLKSLVDSYPNYRFVVTGSAAAALKLKSHESGAGRFTEFMLPPLTFAEYLKFTGREDRLVESEPERRISCRDIEGLNKEFIHYLNYGGYPEAVFSEHVQADSSRYIKSDIIDKVLLRDLPSLYGISDVQELNRLFATLAYNTGCEVSIKELSQTSGVVENTLRKYLDYLEAAFLIQRVQRVDQRARRFKRAMSFKVYLTNPSMRAALFGPVHAEHEAMGKLTETAIYSQLFHDHGMQDCLYYARWDKGEIDIVWLDKTAQRVMRIIEVKWSDRVFRQWDELRHVIRFAEQNKPSSGLALVTTRTISATKTIKGIDVWFIPSSFACYVYGVTASTREMKRMKELLGRIVDEPEIVTNKMH